MTKWNVADSRSRSLRPAQSETHVIWRGIGCLLMLIVPIMSYLLATIFVSTAITLDWPIPYQLLGNPIMPAALWRVQLLSPILGFIESQPNLYANLVVAVVFILVLSGLLTVVYAVLYRMIGPSRYGPLDAPPPKISARSYKR